MFLEEEKVLKFAMDVLICKYFDFIGNPYHPKAKAAKERIATNGPIVFSILENIKNPKKQLGKLAFITGVLIDAFDYYFHSFELVTEKLKFFKSEQSSYWNSGMYDYHPENDNHKDISQTARKYIQIASIVAVMSKDRQYRQNYISQINSSLNYLNKMSIEDGDRYKGDHIISMTAYIYALNSNRPYAEAFLNKLNHGYKNPSRYKKHYSMYVQALSYIILTKILVNQDPKEQVEWLLKYRNADGAFFSPYDTVLALQSLYDYTRYRRYLPRKFNFQVNGHNNYYEPSESVSYKFDNTINNLTTFDQDLGYVSFYQAYYDNTITENSISKIETLVKKVKAQNLEIRVNYEFKTRDKDLGNSIITLEVDLPVGYTFNNPKQEVSI